MALMDYRKLCPNSGHALSNDEREALRARQVPGAARTLRCEVCGRTVEACLHPGTGQSLIYAMHLREEAAQPVRAKSPK
jgi:hypothetical protein